MNIKVENRVKKRWILFCLVPFIPSQPTETLKSGNMYLKSIDKNHRRYYEKFLVNGKEKEDNKYIQQLYVSNQ